MSAEDFKYTEQGAYHWSFTYNQQLRRYDPRNHARYDVPLRLLRRHGAFDGAKLGLEIGCGDGVLMYKTLRAGGRIIGLDLSRPGLGLAREEIGKRLGEKPALIHGSSYDLPIGSGAIDWALSVEVIEHLSDVSRYLGEIRRALKPGGLFALTTPHRTPSGVPQDPYHVREYDGAELAACLGEHFAKVSVWGMYPRVLDRMYFNALGVKPVDRVVRGAFKVLSKWVVNPYAQVLTTSPHFGWANLAALCVA